MDEYRAAHKTYLDSPAGKDFIARIAAMETNLTLEAYRATDPHAKAAFIDEQKGIYKVRTLLAELSQPKRSNSATGPMMHSSAP